MIDYVFYTGLTIGSIVFALYNPAMYGCVEPHWSKKFLLGVALIVVSVAGLVK